MDDMNDIKNDIISELETKIKETALNAAERDWKHRYFNNALEWYVKAGDVDPIIKKAEVLNGILDYDTAHSYYKAALKLVKDSNTIN